MRYNAFIMPGKFIVIEGTDGSGKTEQTARLVRRLKKEGKKVATFDFPRYSNPSAYFVGQYLNGAYGPGEGIKPHAASMFYALDRFEAAKEVQSALKKGKVVVANRYIGSNLGHQGGKIRNRAKRRAFFKWDYWLEYGLLKIPKPDLNIILHVPAALAQELVGRKHTRKYLKRGTHDAHEKDIGHLRHAEKTYCEIAKTFPKDFWLVECVEKGKLLPIEEIHDKVWKIVNKELKIR